MMSQCDMRLVWLWEVIGSRNLQETGIHDHATSCLLSALPQGLNGVAQV